MAMRTKVMYCSACDREVRVSLEESAGTAGGGAVSGGEGVCFDYRNALCTGSMCPLFDLPPAVMRERLRGGRREADVN
jgi:hypothetical protein